MIEQNEKRKVEKKAGVKQPKQDAGPPLAKKKRAGEANDEQLVEIIDDLKADLKMRDEEFEQ